MKKESQQIAMVTKFRLNIKEKLNSDVHMVMLAMYKTVCISAINVLKHLSTHVII